MKADIEGSEVEVFSSSSFKEVAEKIDMMIMKDTRGVEDMRIK